MSWESIASREYLSGTASHQLSATALLPSPDGSRHPLDVYEFMEDDIPGSLSRRGGSARHGRGLWECLIGCRHKVNEQLARRMVEQGVRLYNQHKHQAAVMKWRNALKRIRKRDDKFNLIGYLYQAYMDWGKYRTWSCSMMFTLNEKRNVVLDKKAVDLDLEVSLTQKLKLRTMFLQLPQLLH